MDGPPVRRVRFVLVEDAVLVARELRFGDDRERDRVAVDDVPVGAEAPTARAMISIALSASICFSTLRPSPVIETVNTLASGSSVDITKQR